MLRLIDLLEWMTKLDFSKLDDGTKANVLGAVGQLLSAVFALTALLLTLWVFIRQQRLQRLQLRVARETDVIGWARELCGHLSRADALFSDRGNDVLSAAERATVGELRHLLSGLIDHGRLFYPNHMTLSGISKQGAYQGARQTILDALVDAYDILGKALNERGGVNSTLVSDELIKYRREFVSHVQGSIDPRRFERHSK